MYIIYNYLFKSLILYLLKKDIPKKTSTQIHALTAGVQLGAYTGMRVHIQVSYILTWVYLRCMPLCEYLFRCVFFRRNKEKEKLQN